MVSETFDVDLHPRQVPPQQLVLDLDGFEGPLDVLLTLARDQKVDITRISILQLADQYLGFIARANALRLEVAADYLVMAAWLAYLKSRLLLPRGDDGDEPTGPEMAAALTFQLQRLDAMRDAGGRLMARPQLGREFFQRGDASDVPVVRNVIYDITLYDLLKAYADRRRRLDYNVLTIEEPVELTSIEDARRRLAGLLGTMPDWATLETFLPHDLKRGLSVRSAVASTLVAGLEMVKTGEAVLRQDAPFGPIHLKGAPKKQ